MNCPSRNSSRTFLSRIPEFVHSKKIRSQCQYFVTYYAISLQGLSNEFGAQWIKYLLGEFKFCQNVFLFLNLTIAIPFFAARNIENVQIFIFSVC